MKITNGSSVELRSLDGIQNATQAILAGDYDTVESLSLRLHHPFFKTGDITAQVDSAMAELLLIIKTQLSTKHLKSLSLSPCISTAGRCYDCAFPVDALAVGIMATSNLESLSIVNLCLVGTKKDFTKLAASFALHPKLQKLILTCGHVIREGEDEEEQDDNDNDEDNETKPKISPFDAVLEALGKTIPTMKEIALVGGNILGDLKQFKPNTVASFFQHWALQKLTVLSIMISNDALKCIEDTLANQKGRKHQIRLSELSLWCTELEESGSSSLANILSALSPKLKKVTLVIHSFGTGKIKTKLSDARKAKELLPQLTQGLGRAKCTEIRLAVPESHVDLARESIVELLRTNYHITWFQFEVVSGHMEPIHDDEIDFLVKTNTRGRGNLFRQQHCNDSDNDNDDGSNSASANKKVSWITMFEVAENNLSHIYYLVRSHPKEFADMGLRDCSENMVPTTRVVKSLLRQSKQSIVRGLETTVQRMDDNLQEELDALKCRIDEAPSSLYEHLDDMQEEINVTLDEIKGQLKATKQGIKDIIDKKLVKEVNTAMDEQTKEIQKAVDSKLESFSDEIPPKVEQELKLENHKKEIKDLVDDKLGNLIAEIGHVFDSKLKSELAGQKQELEKAFELQLKTRTKELQKQSGRVLFCTSMVAIGVVLLAAGIYFWMLTIGQFEEKLRYMHGNNAPRGCLASMVSIADGWLNAFTPSGGDSWPTGS